MDKIYTDKDYCLKELLHARDIFGNKNTTKIQYDAMQKCLAAMYLYCPEEIQDHVYAHLLESEQRKFYLKLKW